MSLIFLLHSYLHKTLSISVLPIFSLFISSPSILGVVFWQSGLATITC